jgi:hypothetical protein
MSVGDGRAKEHLIQVFLLCGVDDSSDFQPLGKKSYSPINLLFVVPRIRLTFSEHQARNSSAARRPPGIGSSEEVILAADRNWLYRRLIEEVRFAAGSLVEEAGFELVVPL